MTKQAYLDQLRKYLKKLPAADYADAMEYFTEYFEEADEQQAQQLMRELGTPKEAARELIQNLLDKKITEQTAHPKKKSHMFWVACLGNLRRADWRPAAHCPAAGFVRAVYLRGGDCALDFLLRTRVFPRGRQVNCPQSARDSLFAVRLLSDCRKRLADHRHRHSRRCTRCVSVQMVSNAVCQARPLDFSEKETITHENLVENCSCFPVFCAVRSAQCSLLPVCSLAESNMYRLRTSTPCAAMPQNRQRFTRCAEQTKNIRRTGIGSCAG